jgi:hypothetical protein
VGLVFFGVVEVRRWWREVIGRAVAERLRWCLGRSSIHHGDVGTAGVRGWWKNVFWVFLGVLLMFGMFGMFGTFRMFGMFGMFGTARAELAPRLWSSGMFGWRALTREPPRCGGALGLSSHSFIQLRAHASSTAAPTKAIGDPCTRVSAAAAGVGGEGE